MNNTLIQFTLLIPINHRLREFNFRKRDSNRYDCNVANERGERFYFTLLEQDGHWAIDNSLLPAWLSDHATTIATALAEREAMV